MHQFVSNIQFSRCHPLAVGPLGYNGSKALAIAIFQPDVDFSLGLDLNPFSASGITLIDPTKECKNSSSRHEQIELD